MSDEKKDLVKRVKRLISLIKANDPPKNYGHIARRTSKLQGELETGTKAQLSKNMTKMQCTNLNNSLMI